MIISERIFEMLKDRKMSQKEFSIQTGISQSTISDWKTKKTNPASDKIMVICDVLDISPYELLAETEGGGARQMEYKVVGKASNEYVLLENYSNISEENKDRLLAYARELL